MRGGRQIINYYCSPPVLSHYHLPLLFHRIIANTVYVPPVLTPLLSDVATILVGSSLSFGYLAWILRVKRISVALTDRIVVPLTVILPVVGAVGLTPHFRVFGAVGPLRYVVDGKDVGVEEVLL